MLKRLQSFYNPWFIIPFLLWAFSGSLLLLFFNSQVLFVTVNTHHTAFLDPIMSLATELGNGNGIFLILLSLLLFRSCRNWWYVLAAIVCNAVPALLVQFLKSIFNAPRPLKYYHDAPWIHVEDVWHRLYEHSFPSGHSSGVFSLCCFLALVLPRQWAPLGLLFFFLALLVAYTRMYLAAHFYLDVYVGSLVGTTTTLFCFALIRRLSGRPIGIVWDRDKQPGES